MQIYNITPVAKPRMTRSDKWKQRPVVLNYRAFKDECRLKGVEVYEEMRVTFLIPMPKSWSKKKKQEMCYKPHKGKKDADNLLKALLDAVLEDDSFVWSVWVRKIWAYEGSIEIENMQSKRL